MNFNLEEEFNKINIKVNDWNYNIDQVYDVLVIRKNIIIIYKQIIETLLSSQYSLNSDEIMMLISNIKYLGSTLKCMPFNMFAYTSIVLDNCQKYSYKNIEKDFPNNYISLLNKVISLYDKKIEKYELKKDEYLIINFSKLAKRFNLEIEDVYNDWINFTSNSIQENPNIKISELHNLFLDYFYLKHSDVIAKILENNDHNKGLYNIISDSKIYEKVRG